MDGVAKAVDRIPEVGIAESIYIKSLAIYLVGAKHPHLLAHLLLIY